MKLVYFAKYLVVSFENKMLSLTSVNDAQLCERASSAEPTQTRECFGGQIFRLTLLSSSMH